MSCELMQLSHGISAKYNFKPLFRVTNTLRTFSGLEIEILCSADKGMKTKSIWKRIMRRTFGFKRDENGSEERSTMRKFIVCTVHLMWSGWFKSRILRWADHVARMEEGGSASKILTGTPAGNRPLERAWMNLKEIGINTRKWFDSSQDRDC